MEKIQKPSTKFQTISIHNLGSIFRKSQLKNAAIILEFGAWNLVLGICPEGITLWEIPG